MIALHKIRYQNFLASGNQPIEINLDSAKTTLIVGTNGVGKSTISEALCFALYGKPFRNINKPQLVNSITGKNLLVELEFTADKKSYLIRRGLKPTVFEIFCEGKLIDQSAENKDYQKMIDTSIMKINYKAFCQRVILGSANFVPFMQLAAAARRNFIEDLLDIQIFTTMNQLLKEKVNANKAQLVEVDNQITICNKLLAVNRSHREQLKQQSDQTVENNNKQIEQCTTTIAELQQQNQQLTEKIDKLQQQYSAVVEVQQKVSKVNTAINKLQIDNQKHDKEMQFYSNSSFCSTCEQPIDQQFKNNRITQLQDKLQSNKSTFDKLQQMQDKLSVAIDKFEQLQSKIAALQQQQQQNNNTIMVNNKLICNLQRHNQQVQQYQEVDDTEYLAQLEQLQQQKKMLLEQRELNNIASVLLKDDGIKTQVIKQYIPVINNSINRYLDQMGFFCKFEIDSNFDEKIKSRYRDEFSYSSFSEGEKTRIDLALLFTWREIAKVRNSSSINLLILDEIMDSSLDSSGTDEFVNIISKFSDNNNVIVISHKTENIVDKFERTIQFHKVQNFSQIKEQ